ncbi:MAG TPA: tetratricopeptide repeat-containing protein [Thermoanaerobaculia bacterium]|nr:tetratricopeptide repeat-containing protein [Thermoanaerobaculia bacterium]
MATAPENVQGTCFVIMGFGKKTDFETGRVLDLDMSYRNVIKPAVEAAGLRCIRADEIVHSGLIDVPMYEQLLNADVVVADLSTSNKNAFYELGVRHALRPFTTVVICEDGIKTFPFDVNHVAVRQYHHLGEDIGFGEAMRFRQLLTDAIVEIRKKDPRERDSPVYTFLNGLEPPALAATVQAAVQAAAKEAGAETGGEPAPAPQANDQAYSVLMKQVDDAQKRNDFATAKTLLTVIRGMMKGQAPKRPDAPDRPEDPYIIQRLALLTYKSKLPTEVGALQEARDLLVALDPATSNDTETLGLWGAVHKRLWTLTKDMGQLDEAIRGYERGFYLRNDYYNGINLAYMLNVRAAAGVEPAEAIADFVQARRVRREVLAICEQWLEDNPLPDAQSASPVAVQQAQKSRYWVLATVGEARLGLGEEPEGREELKAVYAAAPETWMADSTREQIANLEPLLEKSPLKYIRTDVPQG